MVAFMNTSKQTQKILSVINKKTKVIISIFAGRAGDAGNDPIPEFEKSLKMVKTKISRNKAGIWLMFFINVLFLFEGQI